MADAFVAVFADSQARRTKAIVADRAGFKATRAEGTFTAATCSGAGIAERGVATAAVIAFAIVGRFTTVRAIDSIPIVEFNVGVPLAIGP